MLEILLESITSCGGEAHARRKFLGRVNGDGSH